MEYNKKLSQHSRKMRKEMTKEERHLWYDFLRQYPIQFRRQYVIGNYIADFYCHKAKLVIELDGSHHYDPREMEYDTARTAYMEQYGIQVLRFSNLDVLQRFSSVCQLIDQTVNQRFAAISGCTTGR